MLIVDIYQLGPGLVIPLFSHGLSTKREVQNLFLQHEGLLHLTSKSDDELRIRRPVCRWMVHRRVN